MKADELLDMIGEVDDQMLAEAKELKKRENTRWMKWVAVVVACIAVGSVCAVATPSPSVRWGRFLTGHAENADGQEVYAVGNTATVYLFDVELSKEFYLMTGLSEEEAFQEAARQNMEWEALYQEAMRLGYAVTDAEVDAFLETLKTFMETAENREDVLLIIEQFESEEAYWEYQKKVYQKDLPIQNMNRAKEQQYHAEHPDASREEFPEWFRNWKQTLVDEQNYRICTEK